jgi:hypothetical protein
MQLGHLLHNPLHTALSGGWHAGDCYLERLGRASSPCTLEKDASHQISAVDLLSREFVNRLVPELGACALLTFVTFSEPRTRHACTGRDTESSTKTRASRCRHHLPRVANRFGADFASCGPKASTSRDVWLPRHDSYGRYQPLHEPRQQDH